MASDIAAAPAVESDADMNHHVALLQRLVDALHEDEQKELEAGTSGPEREEALLLEAARRVHANEKLDDTVRNDASALVEQLIGQEKHAKAGGEADKAAADFLRKAHRLGYPSLALLASHAAYEAVPNRTVKVLKSREDHAALEADAFKLARKVVGSTECFSSAFAARAVVLSEPDLDSAAPVLVLKYVNDDGNDTTTYYVACRGSTKKLKDWAYNTDAACRTVCDDDLREAFRGTSMHKGFSRLSFRLRERVLPKLREIKDKPHDGPVEFVFCGHSLGGAMAVLLAADLAAELGLEKPTVVTFGCPRLGDERLADSVASRVAHLRVHHSGDPVPAVPTKSLRDADLSEDDLAAYGKHGAACHVRVSGFDRSDESNPHAPDMDRSFKSHFSQPFWEKLRKLGRFGSVALRANNWHVLECYMSAFSRVAEDGSDWPAAV